MTKGAFWKGVSILSLATALPQAAFAQDVVGQASGTGAPSGGATKPAASLETDEIVVTANKREQNLKDVGLAVSVLQGEAFKRRQINNLADIANAIPGLTFANSAENTPIYTLRGVSFYETSIGAYPAVSVYADEVVLPFPALANHVAYDLERVEVLKGPQGTLFGSNSTGGAINFIVAKPTSTPTAGLNLTYGRFNQTIAEGYVSGPLTSTLRARVALRAEHGGNWQTSDTRPNGPDGKNGRMRNVMGRLLLDWRPSDGARFQININGWQDKSDTQAAQLVGFQNVIPLSPPEVIAKNNLVSPSPTSGDWTIGSLYGDNRFFQATLRSDVDLAEAITMTTVTSYLNYHQRLGSDLDGSPVRVGGHGPNVGKVNTISQELRFSNGGATGFRYVLGGNIDQSNVRQVVNYDFTDSASGLRNGISVNVNRGIQKFTNFAFFGNGELNVLRTVTLKAGARYTDNKDVGRSCSYNDFDGPGSIGTFFYRVLLRGRLGAYPAGACYVINNLGRPINGVAPGDPGEFADTLHEHSVSWRAGIDWKPHDDLLIYANVAKGYKSGSFPTISAAVMTSNLAVKQESVLSLEGGVKASAFDRLLQFSLAGFYYKYNDKQLRAKVVDPLFGIVDSLQNIPKSSVRGVELEVTLRPVRGLSIPASISYIDAKIDEFVGINGVGLAGDFAGSVIPFTPKYQFSVNPEYRFKLANRVQAFIGGGVSYRSSAISVVGGALNPPSAFPADILASGIKAYTLVDLRAGVDINDKFHFSVFGKNVFNQYYWTNVFLSSDTTSRYAGQPATYGVSLGFTFR